MLNTMAIQLLAGAKNWQYLYYFGDTVVYKAKIDSYHVVMEIKQNPAIIYSMERLMDLLESGFIAVRKIMICNTALTV